MTRTLSPMGTPDVSVLLPVRNAAATLREAAESVLDVDDVSLEVLIIDDGSTDGSLQVARTIADRDPRVRSLQGDGGGLVDALNFGIAQSRGRYVARMDADDVSLPGRLTRQAAYLDAHRDIAVVGTQVELTGEVGDGMTAYVAWQNAILSPDDHARDIYVESPLCHPTVMMRAETVRATDGYRDGLFPEDYDLWLRLHTSGEKLAKLPFVGLRWRQHPGQLTRRDPRLSEDAFRDLKLSFLAPNLRREKRPICIWGAGPTGKRAARALERHGVTARRFVDIDPAKIGGVARGVPIDDASTVDRRVEHVLAAVGSRGARALIRARLLEQGWAERRDFTCIA